MTAGDVQILAAGERRRAEMERLKERAIQVARPRRQRAAAALALHYSGARELLSAVQRRAVGGRRVLILSYPPRGSPTLPRKQSGACTA